jgi:methionyl-tRNA formyltransferase
MSATDPTIAFAGDRDIAVRTLRYLTEQDVTVSGLLLPDAAEATHDDELRSLCSHLEDERILRGLEFRSDAGVATLRDLNLDYILSIHYQYIYPASVLDIPTHGVVNLHPAFLPYNRGWHTPSWAILDETPYGATMHFMDEDVDAGEIIARKQIAVQPNDTANSLYQRALDAEFELFKEAWPDLADFEYETEPQSEADATTHSKADLADVQQIPLDASVKAGSLIRKLRALTTNKVGEAAYYEIDGEKYRIQVDIVPESELDS